MKVFGTIIMLKTLFSWIDIICKWNVNHDNDEMLIGDINVSVAKGGFGLTEGHHGEGCSVSHSKYRRENS